MPATGWLLAALLAGAAAPSYTNSESGAEPGPVYLAYAGPYSSSPSSAFGHLFLVLAARPEDPAPLWDVVTFNAITFDADPLRYLTVGVLGGFLGRYDRFAFHQKTREYEVLDDRDLWLLQLRLTGEERRRLEDALARAKGAWLPYTFLERNCAHYLQRVLHEAAGAVPAPEGVVSPTGVFGRVRASRLGGDTFHRPSASRRLALLAEAASPGARARLGREDWRALAADVGWLEGLDAGERRLALELFSLRALEADGLLPAETTAGLARLRLLVAAAPLAGPEPAALSGPGEPAPAPDFHGYPRVGLSYEVRRAAPALLHLKVRAAMHDETDPWAGQQPASTLELLALDLATPLARPMDRPRPRVESAVLFSQRALAPSDWIRPRASWLLEALERRGGLLDAEAPHGELRAGLGRTLRLPGGLHAHGLATLAAVGAWRHGAALAPGLEAGLLARVDARWRLGASWRGEWDAARWPRNVQRAAAWTRLDLGRGFGLLLRVSRDAGTTSAALSLDRCL